MVRAWWLPLILILDFASVSNALANDPTWAAGELQTSRDGNYTLNLDDHCPANDAIVQKRDNTVGTQSEGPKPKWLLPCRTIGMHDLLQYLTTLPAGSGLTLRGVNIVADGTVLANKSFNVSLNIDQSTISGRFDLDGSRFPALTIRDSYLIGALNAENATIENAFVLRDTHLEDQVDLTSLSVGQYLSLKNLYCGKCAVTGQGLHVTEQFYLQGAMNVSSFDFSGSHFDESLVFDGVRFATPTKAQPNSLMCRSCTIAGNIIFGGGNLNRVSFSGASISRDVVIGPKFFGSSINLNQSHIANLVLQAGANINVLSLQNAVLSGGVRTLADDQQQHPPASIMLGALDLNAATLNGDLDLSGLDSTTWQNLEPSDISNVPAGLDLTNASVRVLTDCRDSWPSALSIENFDYEGIAVSANCSTLFDAPEGRQDRFPDGWLSWLDKNEHFIAGRSFDKEPYLYLAKVLSSEGNDAWASRITFYAKKTELSRQLSQYEPLSARWLDSLICLGQLYVQWILVLGPNSFFYLFVAFVSSVILGYAVLTMSTIAKTTHSIGWRVGACVQKLLPLLDLSKEFKDFFDQKDENSEKPRLSRRQKAFFAVYSLWGWVLSFFLIGVLSNLSKN